MHSSTHALGCNFIHLQYCMHVSSSEKQMMFGELYFFSSLSPSLRLPLVFSRGRCVEGVTMYSWLVIVLLLATAANHSGGQGLYGFGEGIPVDL